MFRSAGVKFLQLQRLRRPVCRDDHGNIEHQVADAGLIECNLEARGVARHRRYVERNRCLALNAAKSMTQRAQTPAHVAAAETSAARFVAWQLHRHPASEACLITA